MAGDGSPFRGSHLRFGTVLDESAVAGGVGPRIEAAATAVCPLGHPHLLVRGPVVRGALAPEQLGSVRPLEREVHLKAAVVAVAGPRPPALRRVALVAVDTHPLAPVRRVLDHLERSRPPLGPGLLDPAQIADTLDGSLVELSRSPLELHQPLVLPGLLAVTGYVVLQLLQHCSRPLLGLAILDVGGRKIDRRDSGGAHQRHSNCKAPNEIHRRLTILF